MKYPHCEYEHGRTGGFVKRPYISGYIETDAGFICLEDVLGIYADRGKPRKLGYWIKLRRDSAAKGYIKVFSESLTSDERKLIDAASRFNQTVNTISQNKIAVFRIK